MLSAQAETRGEVTLHGHAAAAAAAAEVAAAAQLVAARWQMAEVEAAAASSELQKKELEASLRAELQVVRVAAAGELKSARRQSDTYTVAAVV